MAYSKNNINFIVIITFLFSIFSVNAFGSSLALNYTYISSDKHNNILDSLNNDNSVEVIITIDIDIEEINLEYTTQLKSIQLGVNSIKQKKSLKKQFAIKESDIIKVETTKVLDRLKQTNNIDISNIKVYRHSPKILLTINNFDSYYSILSDEQIKSISINKEIRIDTSGYHINVDAIDKNLNTEDYTVEILSSSADHNNYIAVIDTGVDKNHVMFKDKKIIESCFISSLSILDCYGNPSTEGSTVNKNLENTLNSAFPFDISKFPTNLVPNDHKVPIIIELLHGTHVSGIAVGNELKLTSSNQQESLTISGYAPTANLIAIKIGSLPDKQHQQDDKVHLGLTFAEIISAFDHIYSLSLEDDINILAVSVSLGEEVTSQGSCDNSDIADYIYKLYNSNIPTVIASGNDASCYEVSNPACVTSAITVGAVDSLNKEAVFSNYNKNQIDIYANGVNVYSAVPASVFKYFDIDYDILQSSGTSMSTPAVAGAFGYLKLKDSSYSVDKILHILTDSGEEVDFRCGPLLKNQSLRALDMEFLSLWLNGERRPGSNSSPGCSLVSYNKSNTSSFSIGFILLFSLLLLRLFLKEKKELNK